MTLSYKTLVIIALINHVILCSSFHPQPAFLLSSYRNPTNGVLYSTKGSTLENKNEEKGPNKTAKRIRPRIPIIQYHDDWVCVNKPAGMPVHRSGSATPKRQFVLASLLKRQLARKVYPVHRLDHRTSGATLFAFDSKTCGLLHKALTYNNDDEDKSMPKTSEKNYVALVRGDWKWRFKSSDVVTIDKPLKVKEEIKHAKTEFRLLASSPGDASIKYSPAACSLLLCTPKTGRTHQIRRHASTMGFPIIGDTQHGDTKINRWWRQNRSLDRLFLHCLSLDLPSLSAFEEDIFSKKRSKCVAPLLPELVNAFQHEDLRELWNEAKGKDPRLALEVVDERGGSFGRDYKKMQ